jgi:hypothetical protein
MMIQSPPSLSSVTLVTEPKQVYYPEHYIRDLRRIGIRLPYAPGDIVYVRLDKSLTVYSYQFDQIVKRYSTTSKGREYHYAAQFTPLGNHHGPSILSYMVPEGYHNQRHQRKPPKFLVWFRSMFLPCFWPHYDNLTALSAECIESRDQRQSQEEVKAFLTKMKSVSDSLKISSSFMLLSFIQSKCTSNLGSRD